MPKPIEYEFTRRTDGAKFYEFVDPSRDDLSAAMQVFMFMSMHSASTAKPVQA